MNILVPIPSVLVPTPDNLIRLGSRGENHFPLHEVEMRRLAHLVKPRPTLTQALFTEPFVAYDLNGEFALGLPLLPVPRGTTPTAKRTHAPCWEAARRAVSYLVGFLIFSPPTLFVLTAIIRFLHGGF